MVYDGLWDIFNNYHMGMTAENVAEQLGGAVALGHPIGASGAVLVTKLLHELQRRQARYGLVTLCIGGGMGIAVVFERVAQ